jgi:hypothetical protein
MLPLLLPLFIADTNRDALACPRGCVAFGASFSLALLHTRTRIYSHGLTSAQLVVPSRDSLVFAVSLC